MMHRLNDSSHSIPTLPWRYLELLCCGHKFCLPRVDHRPSSRRTVDREVALATRFLARIVSYHRSFRVLRLPGGCVASVRSPILVLYFPVYRVELGPGLYSRSLLVLTSMPGSLTVHIFTHIHITRGCSNCAGA